MRPYIFIIFYFILSSCNVITDSNKKINKDSSSCFPKKTIPIITNNSGIKLNVNLNDTINAELVFDTGIPEELIIDSAFASKHNLLKSVNFDKQILLYQINKTKPHGEYFSFNNININLEIGDYKKTFKNFYIINLEKEYGCKSDIIAGCALFEDKIFEINYTNSYLHFFQDSLNIIDSSKYYCVNLNKINRRCYSVNSQFIFGSNCNVSSKLMLDTGSPRSLMITNMSKKDILNIKKHNKRHIIEAIDIFSRTRTFYSSKLIIDNEIIYPFLFENPVAVLSPLSEYNGIIGNDFFKQYNPIFDFINKKLYLNKIDNSKVFKSRLLGLEMGFFVYKNGLVTGIVQNSNAEKLGLKPNDHIISVDSIPIDSVSLKEYLAQKKYYDDVILKVNRNGNISYFTIKKTKVNY